jgi:hypothetical protein
VSRHQASFRALVLPALAAPVLATGGVTAAAAATLHVATPTPSPAAHAPGRPMPGPPQLVSPMLPPLEVSVITPVREPVAGENYVADVTVTNVGGTPAQHVRLALRLSPDLTLPWAPAGCAETYGIPAPALQCDWTWIGPGDSVIVPLTVRATNAGYLVAIGAILRYDWGLWAYANIIRLVQCPPCPCSPPTPSPSPKPPPPPPSPPPKPKPVPVPVPPGRHPAPARPRPPAPHVLRKAVVAPPAPAPASPAPRPRPKPKPKPSASPTPFNHVEELPIIPEANPKPVVPLVVLIVAVLTPCVAAAATRFGKR